MNKNTSIILILVAVLIVGVFFVFPDLKNSLFNFGGSQNQNAIYQMTGQVSGAKGSSVFIDGKVGDSTKTVEFIVNSSTKITKNTLKITKEQITSGKPYKPEMVKEDGSLSDLKKGVSVMNVKSSYDLTNKDTVVASEINYVIYDAPKSI